MTVKQNTTTSTSSKKKTTTSASTSKASTSKTVSKEVGTVSKSSSSSSLKISDVSHLPVQTSLVRYSVTETLPQETGEKITHYTESGASSTEYRHFIAQDASSKQATNITQISSELNRSIQNLAKTEDNANYTVVEPVEERVSYNKNDSAWNGKFVLEQPVKTSSYRQETSKQESSSVVKSSSSSKVIEIVDGKERVVDEKHHEKADAASSSRQEQLTSKSGTGVTPEVHYTKKSRDSATAYDSARPELAQPKTETRESFKETHQVGDQRASNAYKTKEVTNANLKGLDDSGFGGDSSVSSTHAKGVKTAQNSGVKTEGFSITNDSSKKTNTTSSKKTKDSTTKQSSSSSYKDQVGSSTVTTTTTYYDSKGNVIKTVDDSGIESSVLDGSLNITDDSSKKGYTATKQQVGSSSKNVQQAASKDHIDSSTITTTTTFYDSKGNIIKTVNGSGIPDGNLTITDSSTTKKEFGSSSSKNIQQAATSKAQIDTSTTTTYYDSKGNIIKTIGDSGAKTGVLDGTFTVTDDSAKRGSTTTKKEFGSSKQTDRIGSSSHTTTYYDSKGNVVKTVADSSDKNDFLDTTYTIDDAKSVASDATYTLNESVASDATYTLDDINVVDSTRIRQTATDSRDFYGYSADAKQVMKDNTDVMYTNERNYGKTGWNGKFVYETPAASPGKEKPRKGPKTSTPKKGEKIVSETYTTIETKPGPTPTGQLETIYTETVYKSVDDLTDIKDSSTNVEYTTKSDVRVHVDESKFVSTGDVVDYRSYKDVKDVVSCKLAST